jgi:hypothetical protein
MEIKPKINGKTGQLSQYFTFGTANFAAFNVFPSKFREFRPTLSNIRTLMGNMIGLLQLHMLKNGQKVHVIPNIIAMGLIVQILFHSPCLQVALK